MWQHNKFEEVKKEKRGREVGRVVGVRETTEESSRAERGEKGLEVEEPGGQTVSRREMEKKKSETESKHGQGRT